MRLYLFVHLFLQKYKQDKPENISVCRILEVEWMYKKKVLEAINNPDCGYYYRTNRSILKMPGMPIAYWAGSPVIEAYKTGVDEGSG